MFADDTAVISQNKRFSVVISNLQHYVSSLELWLNDWKIKVNASKSACLMFTRRSTYELEPREGNANGTILSNWAISSAIDIIAPDTPTHFNHNAPSTVIDIGFAANLSHSNVFTINELSSDHNPVIFDFVINAQLPPLLQTLKTTNWIKFQEILLYNMQGNPTIDNLDQAVQNFSNIVSDAINTSTSTRVIKTTHLRLPINIRELIKTKNRFRKL
ncbi:putative RNA-directed DNA polymerase from transposon X-element [Trichonephila clavipes]|nr:putative RNA-directed DNA polymerase from transposon X-element [Trichonephila clavipes]